jgi:CBS-domain-containing membrane protein
MQTTVFDVVHMFSELGISAVPIIDKRGRVINLYETVDVIVSRSLWGFIRTSRV